MIHLFFLAFGVCMALLCHWIIRHTFEPEWVESETLNKYGYYKERVWKKPVLTPRWVFVLIWTGCILLAPLSFIAPILIFWIMKDACDYDDCKFIYTNKLIEWLKKEV